MPFKSDKQRKACYATNGFNGAVDCDEWAHSTKKMNYGGKREKMQYAGQVQATLPNVPFNWTGTNQEQGCPPGMEFNVAQNTCLPIRGAAPLRRQGISVADVPAINPTQPFMPMSSSQQQLWGAEQNIQGQPTSQPVPTNPDAESQPIGRNYYGAQERIPMKTSDQINADLAKKVEVNPSANPPKEEKQKIDPYFAVKGLQTAAEWLGGIKERNRQNQYMGRQFSTLGQNTPGRVEDYQPTAYNLYARHGGSLRKWQVGGLYNTNKKAFVDSTLNANKNLDWVQRLYQPNTPSIQIPGQTGTSTHFMESGDGQVYPTVVNENGQLRYLGADARRYADSTQTGIQFQNDQQAQWFGNNYKMGTNVLRPQKPPTPPAPKGYHTMPDGTLMKDTDMEQMKEGGWIKGAINPAHKGYCTPMTKETCTPRRKAFARRAKAHFKEEGGEMKCNYGGTCGSKYRSV